MTIAGIDHTTSRGHARCGVRWSVSPHPSPLPWGEGEPFSARRAIQTSRLSTAPRALFPLPEGEGQGEGNGVNDPLPYRTIPGTVELDKSSSEAGSFPK